MSKAPVIDVTEYGAIGDGKTDCTEAIRAAFADAKKHRAVVVFPAGMYYIQNPLELK